MSHDHAPACPSYSREFSGPEGLARVPSVSASLSAADPAKFRMRVESRPLARTRILDIRITPHRGVWNQRAQGRVPESIALFQFVLSGRAIGNIDGRTMVRSTGSISAVSAGSELRYVADAPMRTVTLWVAPELVSAGALDAIRRISAMELRADTNARGAEAILRSILRIRPEPGSAAAAELEDVLIAQLESAVLAADVNESEPIAGLYTRIRAAIDADPALDRDAAALAGTLDVSASRVQRALLAHRTTAAQLTRELRFDRLSALLRSSEIDIPLAELAERAGYGGADQAGRAFRDRTGITMSSYRRLARL